MASAKDNFCWMTSRFLLVVLLVFSFLLGILVAGVGLHDPDTCWLLALGRSIFEQGALPATDPFSFTFALQPQRPFVMYQWLTELLFYISYKAASLAGLLMLTSVAVGYAFLVTPLRLAAKRMPLLLAISITLLGTCAAAFHFLARPEIFSYLFLGFCLTLIATMYSSSREKISWATVAGMTMLMLVWTNAHSGFFLGILLQFSALVLTTVQYYLFSRKHFRFLITPLTAFIASTAATVVNPYGIGLWKYLPSLFFASFNSKIEELRPISLADLSQFTFWPFVILSLIAVMAAVRMFNQPKSSLLSSRRPYLFSLVIMGVFIISSISARRMIPFAVLVLIAQSAQIWKKRAPADSSSIGVFALIEQKTRAIFDPRHVLWPVTVTVLVLVGTYLTISQISKPVIPQTSNAFNPPFKALDYLADRSITGNLFNDAQFGDLIILYHPTLKVFIDTRYDMYGEHLITDYVSIMSCAPGWQKLLDQYQIQFVFVPPQSDLAKKIVDLNKWSLIYGDKASQIYERKPPIIPAAKVDVH